jgi:hypothetical protein
MFGRRNDGLVGSTQPGGQHGPAETRALNTQIAGQGGSPRAYRREPDAGVRAHGDADRRMPSPERIWGGLARRDRRQIGRSRSIGEERARPGWRAELTVSGHRVTVNINDC